eukprot:g47371.t1
MGLPTLLGEQERAKEEVRLVGLTASRERAEAEEEKAKAEVKKQAQTAAETSASATRNEVLALRQRMEMERSPFQCERLGDTATFNEFFVFMGKCC